MIFDGLEPMSGAPNSHDVHDLDLPSDGVQDITPMAAPSPNLEQIAPSKYGQMDPATEAVHSSALEPNIDSTSKEICVVGPLD